VSEVASQTGSPADWWPALRPGRLRAQRLSGSAPPPPPPPPPPPRRLSHSLCDDLSVSALPGALVSAACFCKSVCAHTGGKWRTPHRGRTEGHRCIPVAEHLAPCGRGEQDAVTPHKSSCHSPSGDWYNCPQPRRLPPTPTTARCCCLIWPLPLYRSFPSPSRRPQQTSPAANRRHVSTFLLCTTSGGGLRQCSRRERDDAHRGPFISKHHGAALCRGSGGSSGW